ncbi:uncharacterized protein MELLADRAFT_85280 [Melampsora larici-populina 98AG31]|uniref:DUF7729 domain-containing protein n=1 Tax=Melampsora larici-populina (strain 98AG31 / pathotype 3-4-7) TaxID=747676 RepID=F4RI73_MELLP|nr:uncharacterized protein MELLADRAFT_85280 [Melampsora larici-populina 98AG31]EGG08013.1 hypothetical protein MELLADRAFT_85280 [Melampsora larici-populina 98AG31]
MLKYFKSVILLISIPAILAADSPWPSSMNSSLIGQNSTSLNSTNKNNSASSDWNPSAEFNPGTNARIPSSVSGACQAFLARLNSNSEVKACTAPLMNATASFSSGASSVTPDQVQSAFHDLCGPASGNGCQTGLFHEILSHFSGNCSDELHAGIPAIRSAYDVLYIMTPYKRALCAQDPKTGDYCPTTIASSVINSSSDSKDPAMSATDFRTMITSLLPSGKLVTQLGGSLTRRAIAAVTPGHAHHNHDRRDHASIARSSHLKARDDNSSYTSDTYTNGNVTNSTITNSTLTNSTSNNGTSTKPKTNSSSSYANNDHPDPTTFTTTNLAFLFLSPTLPKNALCTPCTIAVMASYIAFEQSTPHFGGLRASGYLSGQVKLWQGITGKCGAQFAQSISDRAGIVNLMSTSDATSIKASFKGVVGITVMGSILALLI